MKKQPGRCFLMTFRPLAVSPAGRAAARARRLPPFLDGSCRREPDFESTFPSITAICGAGNFASLLRVGDRVAYLTVKGRYPGNVESGWCFVAMLRVIRRFSTHRDAASWYRSKGHSVPGNCFVEGNPPIPLEFTNRRPPPKIRKLVVAEREPARTIRLWDAAYRQRVARWPVFLVTKAEFLELNKPPLMVAADMLEVFGVIPATLKLPEIGCERLARLLALAAGRRLESLPD